jgi:hypothetical protein
MSVGIAPAHGLDGKGVRVRFPREEREFSLLHISQIGSDPCPVSHPVGTGGSSPPPFGEGEGKPGAV